VAGLRAIGMNPQVRCRLAVESAASPG
jgi:hypothetical protein